MKKALLIGGTGFLGGAIARRLTKADYSLTLPTRHRERTKHLTMLPTTEVVEADVHHEATLARLMAGQDVVISLVGILKGNFGGRQAELVDVVRKLGLGNLLCNRGIGKQVSDSQ